MVKIEEIEKYYHFLDHKETELRTIEIYKEGGETKSRIKEVAHVSNLDELLAFCEKWDGKGNIYAGIHERKIGGTKSEDVIRVKTIPLDIDAIRPTSEAATEAELKRAKEICDNVCEKYKHYGKPMLVMTGNGYQILWKISPIEVNDDNRELIEKKIKKFIKKFIKEFTCEKAQLDQIGDLPRILKVPGTTSVKGSNTKERPFRVSVIIQDVGEPSQRLRDDILLQKTEGKTILPPRQINMSNERLESTIKKDKKFKDLYEGDTTGYRSRSEAEMALACKCVFYGFNIDTILSQSRIGKWGPSHPQYKKLTESKAESQITDRFNWERKDRREEDFIERGTNTDISKKDLKEGFFGYLKARGTKWTRWQTARVLSKNDHFACMRDNEELYHYEPNVGIYKKNGEVVAKERIREIWGEEGSRNDIGEILAILQQINYTERVNFNPPNRIVVKNGILDLKTLKLEKFSPQEKFTFGIPIRYDPKATCPKIKKFIKEVVYDDDVPLIQEMFGYCLLDGYPFSKAFMLYGCGANGKSTLLNLLSGMLGRDNVKGTSLQEICYSNFAAARLYGKLANIDNELPSDTLIKSNNFKKLTGGDYFEAEIKHKQDTIQFYNRAKFIFATNTLPVVQDTTLAFFRRWITIEFPYIFEEDDQDQNLAEKLMVEDEMSGLLNWSLEGMKRLIENNKFSMTSTREEIEKQWIALSDPLRAFVDKYFIYDPEFGTLKKEFYGAYVQFCNEVEAVPKPDNTVGKEIKRIVPKVRGERHKIGGQREGVWDGLRLKGDVDLPEYLGDGKVSIDITKYYKNIMDNEKYKNNTLYNSKPMVTMVHPLSDTNTVNDKTPNFEKKSDDGKGVPGIPTHFSRPLAQKVKNILNYIVLKSKESSDDFIIYDDILMEAERNEINEEDLKKVIIELKNKGKIYEPKPNLFGVVD